MLEFQEHMLVFKNICSNLWDICSNSKLYAQLLAHMPDINNICSTFRNVCPLIRHILEDELERIVSGDHFIDKKELGRKEFALFVMENYRTYQSLLFSIYDGKLKDDDLRKFVYRRRFGGRKGYL